MDKSEEEQCEEIEDYCRQLGLQLREEHESSTNTQVEDPFQQSVLGAAQQTQNDLPIPASQVKLQSTDKAFFECKKCVKNFANSRQFLKHKCAFKTKAETQTKAKGKKRGRKPRAKACEATETVDEGNDHLTDHTYINVVNKPNSVNQTTTSIAVQCVSCQLLAEIDPETADNPQKIPCEKCQELAINTTAAEKLTDEAGITDETDNKPTYIFKAELKVCPYCFKILQSQKRFEKHLTVCKKNLVCSFCNKDFRDKGRLAFAQYQQHYYTHVEKKPFTCEVCSRDFIRKADLDRHKIIHTDNYSLQRCTQCGAVFATKASLAKHVHKHERSILSCDKCGQKFAKKATFDKHAVACQAEKSCKICGKVFHCLSKNLKARYQEHMYIHTGEKPFKCQFCERGFRDRSTRRKHERTHTGEKPYACTVCKRAFSQLRLLRNHVRTHTGEKPYSCELCSLSFAKSCNLKYHMRVHTREKPYSCSLCKRSFTQSGTYHKHMRRHTNAERETEAMLKLQSDTREKEEGLVKLETDFGKNEEVGADLELFTDPSEQIIDFSSSIVSNTQPPNTGGFNAESISMAIDDSDVTKDTSDVATTEILPRFGGVMSEIVDNAKKPEDSEATIPEMPSITGDEITIIVSDGEGVSTATLATIDVDQISSILASCS